MYWDMFFVITDNFHIKLLNADQGQYGIVIITLYILSSHGPDTG